jgi:hypothetical protein
VNSAGEVRRAGPRRIAYGAAVAPPASADFLNATR